MLTRRGRLLLVLGGALYVAAWAFGSQALYPVAIGFLLTVLLSAMSVHAAARPMAYRRRADSVEHVEGDDVVLDVELEPRGPLGLASVSVVERFATTRGTPDPAAPGRPVPARPLRAPSRFHAAATRSTRRPRSWRIRSGSSKAAFRWPSKVRCSCFLRIVELDVLFSESGPRADNGRRLLLRRPSGFDVHSVREYEEGESLRKVHWKSTARRGQLMVKELQDEPRDEVAILLDADARSVAGDSFDAQVRAAGSLLRTQLLRDRRAVLVVNSLRQEVVRVQTALGEWRQALETLAAVEPTGRLPLAALLVDDSGPAARAFELAVVTSRLDGALVDRVVHRSLAQRRVSVVYVDAPTFAGARASREPGLLRLQASGVPVAVVRRGDDLRDVLGAAMRREAARA